MESDWQDDDPRPNVSKGKMVVYCGQVPDPLEHVPFAESPCGHELTGPNNQPDWSTHFECGDSDTAEVILRNWEVMDSDGNRAKITDTIIVMRLKKLTSESILGEIENHLYSELERSEERSVWKVRRE